MILPLLGGSPAVWNGCVTFFQALLFLGYLYSHLLSSSLQLKKQFLIHLLLLSLSLLTVPLVISERFLQSIPGDSNPLPWLFQTLLLTIGLPFFCLATTAPLLQKWFSTIKHKRSDDPYFLYATSNGGSFLALLGYPFIIEPILPLGAQSNYWRALYLVFTILLAISMLASHARRNKESASLKSHDDKQRDKTSHKERLYWLILSFIPSSLLLSVTTYIATDVASIPLLWVVPLALYLLTFIIAFSNQASLSERSYRLLLPFLILPVAVTLLSQASEPKIVVITLHLSLFFLSALYCHTQLAKKRPAPSSLTEFYLWLSLGGLLGAVFNTLLAPILFREILEYPLILILLSFFLPGEQRTLLKKETLRKIIGVLIVCALTLVGITVAGKIQIDPPRLKVALIFLPPVILIFLQRRSPLWFALSFISFFLPSSFFVSMHGDTIYQSRNFFGVLRVVDSGKDKFRYLIHGTTLHGRELLNDPEGCTPLGYYHSLGPIADIFSLLEKESRVGIVGLGAGSLYCYAHSDQRWTFYEINPQVVWLAKESALFHSLNPRGAELNIVIGDARVQLDRAPDDSYDLLVLDAFSSDNIPLHLLSEEAIQIYLRKLRPGGLLVFHISNRFLDFSQPLSNVAAQLNLTYKSRFDSTVSSEEEMNGKDPSHWIVMTKKGERLVPLLPERGWRQLPPNPNLPVWRDDFSNIFKVIKWR